MNHLDRAREVFQIEIEALRSVAERLDDSFSSAVEMIVACLRERGKIVVLGIGKSGNIAKKIAATLTSTGSPALVLDSVDALHGDLGILIDGDVILALSYSGETEELVQLLPALKRFSVSIIAFTAKANSFLGKQSDLILDVSVPKEACPFNLAPTASTTAMMAMGDALAMAILQARGFTKKDFAKHHPSGSIGRSLLLTVKDIMRTGTRNPVALQSLSVQEALLVMTECRSGSLSVVGKGGRLVGVFTDGDLRRKMAHTPDLLSRKLSEVMTKKPVCLPADALVVEALKIFDDRQIDDLIVVNEHHHPVGIVDSQDLPKLKVM